ncbi:Ras-related protein Rab-13 [Tritrichomonas foetus]|uniref:Ras-related protein Rab-13 n=1 Tax=Tritrichomonas foetus TaxID=1144522 RepID=A0A1J4L0C4_9EUKA|nr:Ras-related protein Rab-13 [Tritrichomonas foetus]|eukprot:OHT16584.1 Ras-related protein Rab-13 [Tritrichomonas foetus]
MTDILKVIVVGDSTVGKTALLLKYVDGNFTQSTTTIGVDFKNKNLVLDDKPMKLQLWDTAGQERFKTIAVSYYRRAHGIALLYDVSNMQSFEHIPMWLDSVKQNTDKTVPLILIGNKCDLAAKVGLDEGKQMAEENGVPFFLTSAKTGEGITEAFESLARMIIEDQAKEATRPKEIHVDITEKEEVKKKRCC